MSNTQHTPGPWTFNESIPRMVSSKEGYITRDICRMDASTMQAFNQDANARLIAAAPELLALLKRYRSETPLGHQPHMIAHEADEAIVKATGGKA